MRDTSHKDIMGGLEQRGRPEASQITDDYNLCAKGEGFATTSFPDGPNEFATP